MGQEKGFKFCLDTRSNKAIPFHLACPEHLNIQSLANLPYHYYLRHLTDFWARKTKGVANHTKGFLWGEEGRGGSSMLPNYLPKYVPIAKFWQMVASSPTSQNSKFKKPCQ
jgi:hypothetical protein